MTARYMTERDHTILLGLRDLAVSLDDQIDAIGDTIAALVGIRADSDDMMELLRNGGDIDEFLRDLGIKVIKNEVAVASPPLAEEGPK